MACTYIWHQLLPLLVHERGVSSFSTSCKSIRGLLKVKVKLSRNTPWRCLGVSVTPRPRFTSGERTLGTHWTGGWVGFRAGLDSGTRRKILCLCRGSNPVRPVRSQSLYWLNYPGSLWGLLKRNKIWMVTSSQYENTKSWYYIYFVLMNRRFSDSGVSPISKCRYMRPTAS
jgi:hypothetical protein